MHSESGRFSRPDAGVPVAGPAPAGRTLCCAVSFLFIYLRIPRLLGIRRRFEGRAMILEGHGTASICSEIFFPPTGPLRKPRQGRNADEMDDGWCILMHDDA